MQTTAQITARLKILDFRKEFCRRSSDTTEISLKSDWQRTHSLELAKFVSWQLGHFLFIRFWENNQLLKTANQPSFQNLFLQFKRNAKTFFGIKLFKLQKQSIKFTISK